ncbi:hypothetical protein pipiens_008407 [Culex pipiens pipiens]|uniref:Uncharacterized protein n=1 Tax=Culex pipiens pipiens TaxID=38569 RepID=A0ABD1DHX0_CULPP
MIFKLFLLYIFFVSIAISQRENPMNQINPKSFTPDPKCDKRFFNFGNLKIVKTVGKTTQLSGKVYLLQDIGKNITMESRLFRNRQGRASEEMSYQFVTICKDPADANAMWPIAVVPSYSRCPIRKGVYNVLNFTIARGTLKYMPQDNHHVEASILRNGVKLCGAKLVFDVVREDPEFTAQVGAARGHHLNKI